jgi:hypothetical protein
VFAGFADIQRFLSRLDFSLPRVVIILSNGDVHEFSDWVKALARQV